MTDDTLIVPAEPGEYMKRGFHVIVRRKRAKTAWVKATEVKAMALAADYTKHGFCKAAKIDISYTGTRIWNARAGAGVSLREPSARRIAKVLECDLKDVVYLTKDGDFYEP